LTSCLTICLQLLVFVNAYLLGSEKNEVCVMAVTHDSWWVAAAGRERQSQLAGSWCQPQQGCLSQAI
jgi:hypothetical protein